MIWLQKRLDELGYTHEDLRSLLARHGIDRSRATITGWTNKKPIPLLSNPKEASILAEVLKWSLLELFIAAGYDCGLDKGLFKLLLRYDQLTSKQKKLFMRPTKQYMNMVEILSEEEVEDALKNDDEQEDED